MISRFGIRGAHPTNSVLGGLTPDLLTLSYSTRMVQAVVEGLRLPGLHRKAGLPASTPAFGGHDFARFRPGSHRPDAEVLGPLASFDHANLC